MQSKSVALYGHTYLEFHTCELVENIISHLLTDHAPRDLVVRLSCRLDGVTGHVVKSDDVVEHAHSFVEGTEPVVWSVPVLLEEVVLHKFRNFQGDLVSFCQGALKSEKV